MSQTKSSGKIIKIIDYCAFFHPNPDKDKEIYNKVSVTSVLEFDRYVLKLYPFFQIYFVNMSLDDFGVSKQN